MLLQSYIIQAVPVGSSGTQPLHTLLHGLTGANRKGHECIVLGDFNTRVDTSDVDVVPHLAAAAVPPHLQHDAQHFINIYGSIPVHRRNSDEHDADKQAARHFHAWPQQCAMCFTEWEGCRG
jgi:hypothetical protein